MGKLMKTMNNFVIILPEASLFNSGKSTQEATNLGYKLLSGL